MFFIPLGIPMPVQTLRVDEHRARLHRLPARGARRRAPVPIRQMREALESVLGGAPQQGAGAVVPWHEVEVRVRHAVADQPRSAPELAFEGALDAPHLGVVAHDGRGELLVVQKVAPAGLAEIGALDARVEVHLVKVGQGCFLIASNVKDLVSYGLEFFEDDDDLAFSQMSAARSPQSKIS